MSIGILTCISAPVVAVLAARLSAAAHTCCAVAAAGSGTGFRCLPSNVMRRLHALFRFHLLMGVVSDFTTKGKLFTTVLQISRITFNCRFEWFLIDNQQLERVCGAADIG